MGRQSGGNPGDVRKSALWGSGNRGGEHRSNALWGKGGRGFVTTVLVIALAVPLAAGAGGSGKHDPLLGGKSYISAELTKKQKQSPNELVSVIVQLDPTVPAEDARKAEKELDKLGKRFGIISGFAGEIRAKDLDKLARIKGLTVTEDAPVRPQGTVPLLSTATSGPSSTQLWTHESGVNKLWSDTKPATIASRI